MGAGHSHGQHHGHHHGHHHGQIDLTNASEAATRRFLLAFLMNLAFAVIELIGGVLTNSVAVTSGALHDFGDAIAIGLAIGFEKISRKKSDTEFSYGYRRYSTLAALVTGLILLAGSAVILVAAVPRLLRPEAPETNGMLGLAFLGLAVNGFAAWRMSKGTSLSERMIVWHLLEDVLGWALVVVGAFVMKFFGWPQVDAAMGCVMALWIVWNVARNLKETLRVFLQGVPENFDLEHLIGHVLKLEGVKGMHHVHVWSLDGERHILTGHLIVDAKYDNLQIAKIKSDVKLVLQNHQVFEATLETEPEGFDCADPAHN